MNATNTNSLELPKDDTIEVVEAEPVLLITSPHKLYLDKFIICDVEEDLTHLIISGKPTEQQLKDAWYSILSEYADLTQDADRKVYYNSLKEIARLTIKHDLIAYLISVLRLYYDEELAKELCFLLMERFVFDNSNPEDYNKILNRCTTRLKGVAMQIKIEEAKFEGLKAKLKKKGDGKASYEYYEDVLITLSESANYKIKKEEITLSEFALLVRRHNKKVQALENHRSKKRR